MTRSGKNGESAQNDTYVVRNIHTLLLALAAAWNDTLKCCAEGKKYLKP